MSCAWPEAAEADIVVIERVGIGAAGLEHIIITVVKSQTTDELWTLPKYRELLFIH